MSHWTTVETEVKDRERLKEALDDLKVTYREEGNRIYIGSSSYCYFEDKGGKMKLNHDFYYCKDVDDKKIKKVIDRYAFRVATSEARKKGFFVVDERTMEDGTIKFKLRSHR